jgi:hypothetical protein
MNMQDSSWARTQTQPTDRLSWMATTYRDVNEAQRDAAFEFDKGVAGILHLTSVFIFQQPVPLLPNAVCLNHVLCFLGDCVKM